MNQKSVQSPIAEGATFWQGLMWNFIWLFLNISMTLLNKSIFVHLNFPYPIVVSMIHMICTCIFSYLSIKIMGQNLKKLTFEQHKLVGKFIFKSIKNYLIVITLNTIAAFSLLFCANIMVGNIGIHYTSVAMSQVIRASIPGVTMVLSFLILGKSYTQNHLLTIFIVIAGVVLATYGGT